jgi:tRNA(Arg) A34 adenosine deaminase TadA
MTDEHFMRIAIQAAQEAIADGDMPFGACLVDEKGTVASVARNSVKTRRDTTAHAEVQAIREAGENLESPELDGYVMYATCEPCPMCFSACLWSKLSRIVYAARIEDGERFGIISIPIPCSRMRQLSHSDVEIVGDVLRDESLMLFTMWSTADDGKKRPIAKGGPVPCRRA